MKFAEPRPFADPDIAARKIVELANGFETVQDGRIYIEKINGPMLFQLKASPAEYRAASIAPSRRAGWCCTRAAPSHASPKLAQNCSPDAGIRNPHPAYIPWIVGSLRWGSSNDNKVLS